MFSEIDDMSVRDHIRSPEPELMVPALTMYLLGAQTPFRLGAECTLDDRSPGVTCCGSIHSNKQHLLLTGGLGAGNMIHLAGVGRIRPVGGAVCTLWRAFIRNKFGVHQPVVDTSCLVVPLNVFWRSPCCTGNGGLAVQMAEGTGTVNGSPNLKIAPL